MIKINVPHLVVNMRYDWRKDRYRATITDGLDLLEQIVFPRTRYHQKPGEVICRNQADVREQCIKRLHDVHKMLNYNALFINVDGDIEVVALVSTVPDVL